MSYLDCNLLKFKGQFSYQQKTDKQLNHYLKE